MQYLKLSAFNERNSCTSTGTGCSSGAISKDSDSYMSGSSEQSKLSAAVARPRAGEGAWRERVTLRINKSSKQALPVSRCGCSISMQRWIMPSKNSSSSPASSAITGGVGGAARNACPLPTSQHQGRYKSALRTICQALPCTLGCVGRSDSSVDESCF